MKHTPFYKFHKELNAKMCPFAGFEMPISYGSIAAEHLNVRQNVGIFDVSHMGEFIVKGKNALSFISKFSPKNTIIASTTSTILSNDLQKYVQHPERFLNAHWLNPAFLVPLVELSPGDKTDQNITKNLKQNCYDVPTHMVTLRMINTMQKNLMKP